jgi:hypothetical protein
MPRSQPQARACPDEAAQQLARLLTGRELRAYLTCSPSAYKRLLSEGMPFAADLKTQKPGRRRHRCLRFDLQQVLSWLRDRTAA